MNVLYISLGVILGIPLYLVLNWIFTGAANLIIMLCIKIFPGKGLEYQGLDMDVVDKIFGWLTFVLSLFFLAIVIFCRLMWIIYWLFRAWFRIVRKAWNFREE